MNSAEVFITTLELIYVTELALVSVRQLINVTKM